MQLNKEIINTELRFTADEAMRLVTCLFAIQNDAVDDEAVSRNFQLYQGALFYLSSKLGAELEDEEKQMVDVFAKNILKINNKENQDV